MIYRCRALRKLIYAATTPAKSSARVVAAAVTSCAAGDPEVGERGAFAAGSRFIQTWWAARTHGPISLSGSCGQTNFFTGSSGRGPAPREFWIRPELGGNPVRWLSILLQLLPMAVLNWAAGAAGFPVRQPPRSASRVRSGGVPLTGTNRDGGHLRCSCRCLLPVSQGGRRNQ